MAYKLYDAAYTKLEKSLSLLTILLAFHTQKYNLECWFNSRGKLIIPKLESLEFEALGIELIKLQF